MCVYILIIYMKYLSALLLIMSFAGISIFGFFLFDYAMMNDSNSHCIASVIDKTECPTSAMGMTLHHIASVQTLTTTTVVPSISGLILLIASLFLVLVSVSLFYKKLLFPKLELLPQRLRELILDSLYNQQETNSWLSLFELSPSL